MKGGGSAASYLQELTNFGSGKGWEFYRVDTFWLGRRPAYVGSQVVTFRRLVPNQKTNLPFDMSPPAHDVLNENDRQPIESAPDVAEENLELPVDEKPWWR